MEEGEKYLQVPAAVCMLGALGIITLMQARFQSFVWLKEEALKFRNVDESHAEKLTVKDLRRGVRVARIIERKQKRAKIRVLRGSFK